MAYNKKVGDVAEFTGFQDDTIYRWAVSGFIPHVRVGRGTRKALRFDLVEVQQWMEERKQSGRSTRVPEMEV